MSTINMFLERSPIVMDQYVVRMGQQSYEELIAPYMQQGSKEIPLN